MHILPSENEPMLYPAQVGVQSHDFAIVAWVEQSDVALKPTNGLRQIGAFALFIQSSRI